MAEKRSEEYAHFNEVMDRLLKVPYREIKAKIDAEKEAKKRKAKRASSSRASSVKPKGD